jgi:16S rRNA (cytosine967-C5)-methyltransferase
MKQALSVPVALWQQLQGTAAVVQAVRGGKSGSAAIEAVAPALRPGVQALAFYVWRNAGLAEALRQILVAKKPPADADALLCVALALACHEEGAPYDGHTLVNQTVEAAKRHPKTKAQAHFINACLRRFLRDRPALLKETDSNPVARWNHPAWWIARVQQQHPTQWQSILEASNVQAPMTLRVNQRKTTVLQYLQKLKDAGIEARPATGHAVILAQALPVQQIPGFAAGEVSVQDAAAQRAAELLLGGLSVNADSRILDACAAPGGKTGHLLELCPAEVLALDVDALRCQRIAQNLERLGLKAAIVTADAAQPDTWWDGVAFDAILLDAPCTASGIVRRHPDVRWLRRESDIAQLASVQRRMLQTLWPLVKPGGRLLYCTCSIFTEEGDLQTQTFLANNTNAILLPAPGHCLPQSGAAPVCVGDNQANHDGFYFALFQKQGA